MATCFVIQPFDAAFDKRYDDVFVPAITDAGLEAYRVDRDPGAVIPIEDIEQGIRKADVCLADISLPNPNIWFEVGYTVAAGKPIVLVCLHDPARRFPFDIQHRAMISYRTESSRDFDELRRQISNRLQAILRKQATPGKLGVKVFLPLEKMLQEIQKAYESDHLPLSSGAHRQSSYSASPPELSTQFAELILDRVLAALHAHLVGQPGTRDSLGRLLEALLPLFGGDPAIAGQLLSVAVENEYLHAVTPTSTGRFELSQKAYNRIASGRQT